MVPDLSFSDELKDMAVKTVLDGIPFCVPILEPILVVGLADVHWGLTNVGFEKLMAM